MERRFVVVMPVRGRHLESITSGFSRISDSGLEGKGHGLCLFPIAVFQCQRLKIVPSTGHVLFQETQITKCAKNRALSAVEKRVGDDIAVEPATPLFSFDGIAPDSPIPKIGHFISRFGHCLSPPLPQQQKQATTRILRWNRSRSTSRSVGE